MHAKPPRTSAFVSWVRVCGRSQAFIDNLELAGVYVSYLGSERPLLAPLKYGPQAFTTLWRLIRLRPELVFVMDPPPFAVAAVYLYCRFANARFIMDCHSGVFEGTRWRWSLPLQRFFGRRAAAVIVTNPVHFETVSNWPARAVVMGDPPPTGLRPLQESAPEATPTGTEPLIFVIVRFGKDEAVEEILEAARRLPNVRFHISGDVRRAPTAWLNEHPVNVRFTGWLPTAEFWAYVRRANAVLTLTTQENAILRGGWEAMFLDQPLITSDSATLRGYFHRGAVFVDNTAAGIAAGVTEALARERDLRHEMGALRVEKYVRWCEERRQLERVVGSRFGGETPAVAAPAR
jgi:glycosyltransferase involved in cell wall biosynthesis